jgi:hypothetical protein
MHTIQYRRDGENEYWEVVFVFPDDGTRSRIESYKTMAEAMMYCSYLNGGLPPTGYTMGIANA